MSQTYPCKECRETFSKACGFRNQQQTHSWVSLGIFLLWSVNHSFHKRNENDFFTWVSLGIYLLWSINHSFHKRNENDFSTWFSLGNWNWKKIILTSISNVFWHYFGIMANLCCKSRIDYYLIWKWSLLPGECDKTWSISVSMQIEWHKYARSTGIPSLYYNYNKP